MGCDRFIEFFVGKIRSVKQAVSKKVEGLVGGRMDPLFYDHAHDIKQDFEKGRCQSNWNITMAVILAPKFIIIIIITWINILLMVYTV